MHKRREKPPSRQDSCRDPPCRRKQRDFLTAIQASVRGEGEDRISLYALDARLDQILATSRNADIGIVTIDLSQLYGAPADRIELLTDPATDFVFTPADFDLVF